MCGIEIFFLWSISAHRILKKFAKNPNLILIGVIHLLRGSKHGFKFIALTISSLGFKEQIQIKTQDYFLRADVIVNDPLKNKLKEISRLSVERDNSVFV